MCACELTQVVVLWRAGCLAKTDVKAAANSWIASNGAGANASEVLFIALVLLDTVSASDARAWAQDACLALAPGVTCPSALPEAPEWRMCCSKPGSQLELLHSALCGRSWPAGALDHVGAAMQAWRGAGRHNGLTHLHLIQYLQGKRRLPTSPRPAGGKRDGPPRWRSAAARRDHT